MIRMKTSRFFPIRRHSSDRSHRPQWRRDQSRPGHDPGSLCRPGLRCPIRVRRQRVPRATSTGRRPKRLTSTTKTRSCRFRSRPSSPTAALSRRSLSPISKSASSPSSSVPTRAFAWNWKTARSQPGARHATTQAAPAAPWSLRPRDSSRCTWARTRSASGWS